METEKPPTQAVGVEGFDSHAGMGEAAPDKMTTFLMLNKALQDPKFWKKLGHTDRMSTLEGLMAEFKASDWNDLLNKGGSDLYKLLKS